MSKTPRKPTPTTGLSRPVVATGIATTVLIAAGAFVLSFAALTDLAAMAGISPMLAWIWPVIIDGLIIASTVAIVALAGHPRSTMAYPWALLFGGAAVSTAANAVHAILSTSADATVPGWVSAIVASMPPVVMLAVTHLCVILVQKAAVKAPVVKTARRSASKPAVVREDPAPVAPVAAKASIQSRDSAPAESTFGLQTAEQPAGAAA